MWGGGGLQADNPNKTWVAADENKYTDDHDHLLTKIVNTRQGTDILRRKETIRIYDDICIQSTRPNSWATQVREIEWGHWNLDFMTF